MRSKLFGLLAVLCLLLAAVPVLGQGEMAYLRFAQYISDAPALDVWLDGQPSDMRSVLYGNVSDWVAVPVGSHEVVVTTTGGDLQDGFFAPKTVDLAASSWTTIFVAGAVGRSDANISIVTDDYNNIPSGQARVTVFHGVKGAVSVNLFAGGQVVVNTLSYPGAAGSNDGATTIDLPAGNYGDIAVLRADNGAKLLELPNTALEEGKVYLIGAIGLPETKIDIDFAVSDPKAVSEALASTEEVALPEVGFLRAAHFVPRGPAVDLYVDGAVVASGLIYGGVSDFIQVTPGEHEVALVADGGTLADPLSLDTITIPNGNFATVYATRGDNAIANVNVIVEDYSDIGEGEARLTVLHAADGAVPVSLYLSDEVMVLQGLSYPGAVGDNDGSATVDLAAGTYTLSLTSGDRTNLLDPVEATIEGGMYYFVAAYTTDKLNLLVVPTDVKSLLAEAE